ncbi:hypothetical protein ACFST9_04180 [Hymenobacter monticola]|uniref:Uncharacterized protein n=1 Tax=Hymenobacter monticola TaxID=1705399 RepID=A0ABY4B4Z6_9BACT|nr:hypothetical protein [Hymenobacter monticola]UOE32848.1 hypothetical protein MTP16_17140 [Hymenobacter monticola]
MAKQVFNSKQIAPFLDKELQSFADEIKRFMIAQIEAQRQGRLLNDKSGFVGQSKVTFNTSGVVLSLPEQAIYIDQGRRPGLRRVPVDNIIRWLRRYRILGRDRTSGKFRRATEQSINSAAWAIQQAIFRHGIRAKPFINETLEYAEQIISQAVDKVLIPQIVGIVEISFNNNTR